jgi:hypothetical protein
MQKVQTTPVRFKVARAIELEPGPRFAVRRLHRHQNANSR